MSKVICYQEHSIHERLEFIYGKDVAKDAIGELSSLINKHRELLHSKEYHLSEKDIVLITYGDQVQHVNETPLDTLYSFLDEVLGGDINSVHILPFYPYSSDDGFSVVNYSEVDPKLGSWNEIEKISQDYRLMVDGVINHISQFSDWFKAFLSGDKAYESFFTEVNPNADFGAVVRPRATPLFHEYEDSLGKTRYIWTTFSRDQVDLNYANYKVLLAVLDALFYYIQKGATLIRLDAIAFIWKELGSECVHLERTHELIQLMREVLHELAPEVIIITETNVPHNENVSYFGSGNDEAQMVYNFALPPLLVHSIHTQNTSKLTQWAKSLRLPSDKVCFFNFTASHDGCGLRAVSGILNDDEIEDMVNKVSNNGGLISYRNTPEGKKPYELNCSFIDMLSGLDETEEQRLKRMLVTQAAMLAMPGVPGIYFHSLVGSRNYHEGVKLSGINRTINREKLNIDRLRESLSSPGSFPNALFKAFRHLIKIRKTQEAFDPFTPFTFLEMDKRVFAILKNTGHSSLLALHNFSNEALFCDLPDEVPEEVYELVSKQDIRQKGGITMPPYAILWLEWKTIN